MQDGRIRAPRLRGGRGGEKEVDDGGEEAAVERLFPEVSIAISIARLVFPLQWRAPSP